VGVAGVVEAGFAPVFGVEDGCDTFVLVGVVAGVPVPFVPEESDDGAGVGCGSCPGIGSGLWVTLAMYSFRPASEFSWRCL
jgi:hypothetical protein